MNNIPASVFLGPIFIFLAFLVCAVSVAGIKTLYLFLKRAPIKATQRNTPSSMPKTKPSSAPKPVKSIEIDPNEVDKIYVKKVS